MAGVLYLFNYDDLAGVDLGFEPRVDLGNLSVAVDLLGGVHVDHATIDGADCDLLGLSGGSGLGFLGLDSFLRLGDFGVVRHGFAF